MRTHLAGKDDGVIGVAPALERTGVFKAFPGQEFDEVLTYAAMRKAGSIGRPVG